MITVGPPVLLALSLFLVELDDEQDDKNDRCDTENIKTPFNSLYTKRDSSSVKSD